MAKGLAANNRSTKAGNFYPRFALNRGKWKNQSATPDVPNDEAQSNGARSLRANYRGVYSAGIRQKCGIICEKLTLASQNVEKMDKLRVIEPNY